MNMKLTVTDFGKINGRAAKLYTIAGESLAVSVTDFGAAITDIAAAGKNGPVHAALGYPSAEGYLKGASCVGATVGRYAGRIGGAAFSLNGKRYELAKNDGENHLHGGFSKRFWDAEPIENGVIMTLLSPDGDEGFPGGLEVSARFEVIKNTLRVTYSARAKGDTVVNLTNHSYFDLNGRGSAANHELTVNADEFAELGPGNIPTGRLLPVCGTALDFSRPRRLSDAIDDPRLAVTRGLDHSFLIPGGGLREAARLYSPESGVTLVCLTSAPTVHIYTAGFLHIDGGGVFANGETPASHAGVCLETQFLPDSPNKPGFPSTLLRAGETRTVVTEYVFITEN